MWSLGVALAQSNHVRCFKEPFLQTLVVGVLQALTGLYVVTLRSYIVLIQVPGPVKQQHCVMWEGLNLRLIIVPRGN